MDTRGEHMFTSLMKQKIKGKNYDVFYFAGKRFFFKYYEVITWGKKFNGPDTTTTGVPLFTTWDPVSGSGRAPIPGDISGRSRPR
jgi:hypothetical protein